MRWSVDGQTPEFLAVTRSISLCDANVQAILKSVRIESGMSVLDVGCGSGELSFRLGANVRSVSFTGVELDDRFVEFADKRVRGGVGYPFEVPSDANDYRFVAGDASRLPFEDGSFDVVASHTFLTATPEWRTALMEMKRVCKPGGTVASITSMTDDFYGTGVVGLFTKPAAEADVPLIQRIGEAMERTFGSMDLTSGIEPRMVPAAFDRAGFAGVRCAPIGQYFCLSDACVTEAEYRRHVDMLEAVESEQLQRLSQAISDEDRNAFEQLIRNRREELISACGHNREWDWYGNAALLVCGTVPDA